MDAVSDLRSALAALSPGVSAGERDDDARRDAPAGLFLARDGRWFHDGDPIRHERLAALLHRCLARDASGRVIVTTGRDVLPVACEDAPYVVRTLSVDGARAELVLSDETREPIGGRRFVVDANHRVRCPVKAGAFWAVLSRSATQTVLSWLDEDGILRAPDGACTLTPAVTGCDWSALPQDGNPSP
jgi:hypothetical protein